ncbi:MAG: hypothetical protein HYT06_01840 [Candidatus Levybacteria bacterium]|nr:hypothetical protein [Candidatus Levybacteria bacterium]
MDIKIDELIIEEDRSAHIARYNVTVDEVGEVVKGDYVFIAGKHDRWILIGPTKKRKMLAIVVGRREKKNTYGLVATRPAHKKERYFYQEIKQIQGGELNENN